MSSTRHNPARPWSGAELNTHGCLSLETILRSFSAPITEEQAWAIAHQALKCLQNCLNSCHRLVLASEPSQLLIHSVGFVHHLTFQPAPHPSARQRVSLTAENKGVSDLALVVYAALDYGLDHNEQRSLSADMEGFLEHMTGTDERQSDDEGIEQDQDDVDGDNERHRVKLSGICSVMLEECCNHLSSPNEAEKHFRNVCGALVSESLELSTFMSKVSEFDDERASELKELDMQDWARLWVQCIRDLRHGVKLKETSFTKTPVEYELSPYEILMDDIRSRRYTLNKIMVNGEIPQTIKQDAHDIILEFIRSRPPLRPASKRAIKPLRRESTPVEQLMESIRNSRARSSLRKTPGPMPRRKFASVHERSRTFVSGDMASKRGPILSRPSQEAESESYDTRKMIRVDQNAMDELLNFSGDETDLESQGGLSRQVSRDSSLVSEERISKGTQDRTDLPRVSKDLAMYGESPGVDQRRHSLSVCETPRRPTNGTWGRRQKLHIKSDSRSSTSRSSSGTTTPSSGQVTPTFPSPDALGAPGFGVNTPQMHANLQSEFLQSEHWAAALKTLDLNLDEVVHIRSVLTKAELESLPLDGTFKDDVERGKICFLCMKTRFGLFVWGVRCQLCKQQVCNKCSSKTRIPLEHFSSIPTFALSPKLAPSVLTSSVTSPDLLGAASSKSSLSKSIRNRVSSTCRFPSLRNSAGSAPTSPESGRKISTESDLKYQQNNAFGSLTLLNVPGRDEYDNAPGPVSLPATFVGGFAAGRKKSKEQKDLQGSLLQVCTDCREMVLQVIRAQRTAKRFQLTQMLFANEHTSTKYAKEEVL
eukprot:maker-scaffold626_size122949-snap-gene-0.27 protein:Tk11473 transcript:maker-scaffold626_size122949-snap-gene-0.27-mRNA-1 annotation:"spire "